MKSGTITADGSARSSIVSRRIDSRRRTVAAAGLRERPRMQKYPRGEIWDYDTSHDGLGPPATSLVTGTGPKGTQSDDRWITLSYVVSRRRMHRPRTDFCEFVGCLT